MDVEVRDNNTTKHNPPSPQNDATTEPNTQDKLAPTPLSVSTASSKNIKTQKASQNGPVSSKQQTTSINTDPAGTISSAKDFSRKSPSSSTEKTQLSPNGSPLTLAQANSFTPDMMLLTPSASNRPNNNTLAPSQYTPESIGGNFSSPGTPGVPSPSGTFNQFSVNPQGKTSPSGEAKSPTPSNKTKPYVCTECNQTFSRQHNLKSHALTHSQEKPFRCEICNHYFRRHHDLKRHAKLHTGEKPYTCQHCKRSFARLDALNRHLRAESFCGGPQKKLYQNATGQSPPPTQDQKAKLELQPLPTSQQVVPQLQQALPPPPPPLQPTQSASNQTLAISQTVSQQISQLPKSSQQVQPQPQQSNGTLSVPRSDQHKQLPSAPPTPLTGTEVQGSSQDMLKRAQYHDQFQQWHQQQQMQMPKDSSNRVQQSSSNPQQQQHISVKANSTNNMKPVLPNLIIPNSVPINAASGQIVFPVDSTNTSSSAAPSQPSHFNVRYTQPEYTIVPTNSQEQSRRISEGVSMETDEEIHRPIKIESGLKEQNDYLKKRNEYLATRVTELENEQRKSHARLEHLESSVKELEIQKNFLKSLLFERESHSSNEKKRKASSLIEPNSPKHHKEIDGFPQSAQH